MKSLAIVPGQHSIPVPAAGRISVKVGANEQITTLCYENEVPAYIEAELERIYGNFFSTLEQFRESNRIDHAHTYVVIEGEKISTIFLFRIEHDEARVLNEVIKIKQNEVDLFSNYIFSTYGSVDVISFHAVDTDVTPSHRPYQRINCLEDIVLTLPHTTEEYFNSLGKSTRKTIKGYTNKLTRDFPSFQIKTYITKDADEQLVRTIIDFNRARMLSTGKVSAFDESAVKHIIHFVQAYGMICVATINEKICAGSISYRVGDNYFMHVSAHDPQYDSYRLGVLFRYRTICESIHRGGRECHFLWGRQEFKFSLLGIQRDLHDLVLYRSRIRLVLQSGMALHTRLKGTKRQTGLLVRSIKARAVDMVHGTVRILNRLEMLRRSA
ncbi:MAG: GNAT family N-acetyltransferase [Burkholderiaceae bacterium]